MGRNWAICVGVNDYPGAGNDLAGCVNDASDWEAELIRRQFTVAKLLEKQATKKAILHALDATFRKAKSGDLVVVTYSGHGSWQPDQDGDEPDGRDEGWCPYDLSRAGLLLDDELHERFLGAAAGVRIVMFSDSCHSGTVARMAPPLAAAGAAVNRVRFLPPERFLKASQLKAAEHLGRSLRRVPKTQRALLLSGCQDYEYSYDAQFDGRPNGAFTYVALRALRKLKASATYRDWHKLIRQELPNQLQPQTPNLFGASSQKNWKVLA